MDFIDGRKYDKFAQFSAEEKLKCLERVEQLHAIKLLHGDLCASNFIISKSGVVFLIDFGRSRFVQTGEEKELELEMKNFRIDISLD